MKKLNSLLVALLLLFTCNLFSQSKLNDIKISDLPNEVKSTLDKYIEVLNIQNLDECATEFCKIAGGGLVNEDGISLRSNIKQYSLKKDHDNIKFYKQPVVITRVNKSYSGGQGFGNSAIKGQVYKIWISKNEGVAGLPAPVSIMVPEGHATITNPKVVNIGSL